MDKKITPEEIKWMCGYAEKFIVSHSVGTDWIVCPDGIDFLLKRIPQLSKDTRGKWNDVYLPLLLQKAIEGINKRFEHSHDFSITIGPFSIHVANKTETEFFKIGENINETKLAALRYVKKNEKDAL